MRRLPVNMIDLVIYRQDQIQLAFSKQLHTFQRRCHHDLHICLWITLLKLPENDAIAGCAQRLHDSNTHFSAWFFPFRKMLQRHCLTALQIISIIQKFLSCGRKHRTFSISFKQRYPQFPLQRLNLHRHRRLRIAKVRCGSGKIADLCDFNKCLYIS